jgi:UDP-N-acetylmuramate--alanine ligase
MCCGEEEIANMELNIGGMHNLENAVAAVAVCCQLGLKIEDITQSLASFAGVKRRFEYILNSEKHVMIDDYAHHPEELRMLLKSAKALFPSRKLSVVFQPHLFSRTRDLADGFAESLDLADEIILLDIYPARELPMEGVSSEMILNRMANPVKQILSKEGLLQWVKATQPALLVTAGAGDIDACVEPIKQILIHGVQ